MKKLYSKPGIVYEDFSICTHIAKTCDVELGTFEQGKCGGYEWGRDFIFMDGQQWCDTPVVDDGTHDGICYHHPIDGARLFNS